MIKRFLVVVLLGLVLAGGLVLMGCSDSDDGCPREGRDCLYRASLYFNGVATLIECSSQKCSVVNRPAGTTVISCSCL